MPAKGSTKTSRLLSSMKEQNHKVTPIATDMIIPNHSGISSHPEAEKNFSNQAATFIVAASDSNRSIFADYVCDGTADEVEINQAIGDLPSTGGTIVLLEGTYNIAAVINLDVANSTLKGVGWASIFSAAAGITAISIDSSDCEVSDMNITGGAIGIDSESAPDRHRIINCLIRNSTTNGIKLESQKTIIKGCQMTGVAIGILIEADSGAASNNIIDGNVITATGTIGINIVDGKNIIRGNRIIANETNAKPIRCVGSSTVIANNVIEGVTVGISTAAGTLITGNFINQGFETAGSIGIALANEGSSSDQSVVSANIVDGWDTGIRTGNSDNCVISNNVIEAGGADGDATGLHVNNAGATRCILMGNSIGLATSPYTTPITDSGTGTVLIGNVEG